ncbi:LysR family transcriptional regulator [Algihabitans sp.]|uniref:LysR family transcriptional regulator n=1 Tax=Algihabitans sp. TaxID=2821514 RepID=UPI003BAC94A1
MLIRHLSFFITLARERHFARAAAACNVTQPTLSATIRKLEEELDVHLVIRDHRFVGLTEEGEKLLTWGRQILADYDSLKKDLSGDKRGLTGTLRLGVIPATMPAVSFVTSRYSATHPAVTIDIRSMSSRSIQAGLDAFELDGGMTYLDNEPLENVQKIQLYEERYVLVVPKDHRLASSRTATWKAALKERLCLLSEDMQNRRILNRLAESAGLEIHPHVVSNSFLALFSHLRQGEWASIMPHTFAYVVAAVPGLVAIDLVDPVHTQPIGLVLPDRDPLSPLASALLACFKEQAMVLEPVFGSRS